MFGALWTLAGLSQDERDRLAWDMLRYATPPGAEQVDVEDQCVNCSRMAEPNGWCRECWATIVPAADRAAP